MSILPEEKYLSQEEVFTAFKNQLIKDANTGGITLNEQLITKNLQSNIKYFADIIKHISDTANGFEKIQRWLYRVDVPESFLKQKLQQSNNIDYYHTIAELIIKRTLQKIVTRYLYK